MIGSLDLFLSLLLIRPITPAPVATGLDVLRADGFALLRGKRVGLITNQTGLAADGESGIDLLAHAPGVRLTALFAPEHGIRGAAGAGEPLANGRDRETGVAVYSLYGATRRPSGAMLHDVDLLVYDLQDIGARSYTYISTLGLCMRAAAEAHIPMVVLDRPDPVGGDRVEGNIPEAAYRSFVGRYPIPYLYGMTAGELARAINGERWETARCDLAVVPMQGYRRTMSWQETGIRWIPTSPHVPHADTALFYAATGIAGELSALSIGIGTQYPFEVCGAPGLDGKRFASILNARNLPGVTFEPFQWTPGDGVYSGRLCSGARIRLTDADRAELTRINFEQIAAARKIAPSLPFFMSKSRARMFDLVCGTDLVRRMVVAGRPPEEVWRAWDGAAARFRVRRTRYLLYP